MKRLIAHRGITDGNYSGKENLIYTIMETLDKGYEVEADIQCYNGILYLGHDERQEPLDGLINEIERHIGLWGYHSWIWYHCKDKDTLSHFVKRKSLDNYFWHDVDKFTLTSKGYVWTADLSDSYPDRTVVVVKNKEDTLSQFETDCFGICSPFVGELNAS